MPDLICPSCGASASLPLRASCSDHRPEPVRAPSTEEACERISTFLHVWPDEHINPWPIPDPFGRRWLLRADLVALVAHCGWNVDVNQARVDTPEPVVDVDMFGGGS